LSDERAEVVFFLVEPSYFLSQHRCERDATHAHCQCFATSREGHAAEELAQATAYTGEEYNQRVFDRFGVGLLDVAFSE
jgi:hypothetical protein